MQRPPPLNLDHGAPQASSSSSSSSSFPCFPQQGSTNDPNTLAVQRLSETFFAFVPLCHTRLEKIENAMGQLIDVLSSKHGFKPTPPPPFTVESAGLPPELAHLAPPASAPPPPPPPAHSTSALPAPPSLSSSSSSSAPAPKPSSSSSSSSRPSLRLEIEGTVEDKWYTKKSMPDFCVVVREQGSGEVCTELGNEDGAGVCLRLLSGHGIYVDSFLTNTAPVVFPLVKGKATVTGIKFSAVSSRNGGHFLFELSLQHPTKRALPVRSGQIKVLSERLKNEQKASSILELSADDPLARVPGIGKRYAAKLADQNLFTIRDLAAVDSSPSGRTARLQLLTSIRKDRGALTEAKLAELLRDAKMVVRRDDGALPAPKQTLNTALPAPKPKITPTLNTNTNTDPSSSSFSSSLSSSSLAHPPTMLGPSHNHVLPTSASASVSVSLPVATPLSKMFSLELGPASGGKKHPSPPCSPNKRAKREGEAAEGRDSVFADPLEELFQAQLQGHLDVFGLANAPLGSVDSMLDFSQVGFEGPSSPSHHSDLLF